MRSGSLVMLGLAATLILPTVLADSYYHEQILGAWNKSTGQVNVNVEVANVNSKAEALRAIQMWKNGITDYSQVPGKSNLGLLDLNVLVPDVTNSACVPNPVPGQLQSLLLDDTVGSVCLIPPDPLNLPNVIAADVATGPVQDKGYALGVTENVGAIPLWYVRELGIEVNPIDGEFIGPTLIVLGTAGWTNDIFNTFAHEFGHSIGPGHTYDPALSLTDIMYYPYNSVGLTARRCLSTMNMEDLYVAYHWLGGAYDPPPTSIPFPVSSYNGLYECPSLN